MYTEKISVSTSSAEQMIDVTDKIQGIINKQRIEEGTVFLYVPHTTAAVTINESADPNVQSDIIASLHRLIPPDLDYRHFEGNSDAHIKSSLIGCNQTILIKNKRLVLGTWQAIFFCEFDGPRNRNLIVRIQ